MTSPAVKAPRGGPVTRKDVARYAGVSTAVVSYVVNGGPKKVAPATEAKVQDAIRVLGYRPNAAARALKLGSSETLG
ncbi:LacI family DNA-binding transcriptional regulator, partial [Arthrobacter sp. NQ7]